ncbi:SAM-dependent methyltransferase [Streptomyces viridochromogenes]|uniref:SAM-dependent methyltransferase n=1 Tax=Streptomyces viridochromogenes TaxID=1938 RepID=A0A0J7Z938_STRVR|nr:class I SAM-dependent methyltransferase [Streptomyces viridochromogenes]KMS71673.1 SAM-dependent methyltransferase [Streptomyces viridochromogenes]KOG11737.1 SAM-dependent methyltransferase [Streptomyces viridochromogenes]KOG26138.1 SAM-dependent methyltransferase [Streptomyces viridochromogenes]
MTETPALKAAEFWEGRYRDGDRLWSGRPNALLVREAAELAPGTALDLGCGEGGDVVWLAARGWRVTGVDISHTALERAAGHAAEAGLSDRTAWERHVLGETFPEGSFDLVNVQFLQSPVALDQRRILRQAAEAVAAGGTLLIVMHAGWPSWQSEPPFAAEFPTLDSVLDELALPKADWTVETLETVRSVSVSPEGVEGFRDDNVWRIRRGGDA